jgi:aspartyl-tRNA(Asn)/glutamyl-tRNA(Gln) amidotransferase subunit A
MRQTLAALADALATGRVTAEDLVEQCLDRIADPTGEGARACLTVDADGARSAARAVDAARREGRPASPYAGIPVTVKDLFDVRDQITRAGSRALAGPPAQGDAPVVAGWRAAGLIPIARTNMTEFAFSGLGINPHYGTPTNPWDREHARIPGGSSSGAAVSVSDGMAHGALGSDTGGSCRIPAALCGLAGYKPTQSRLSRQGMIPLSPTLDAVGVIGRSVRCCIALEALARHAEPHGPDVLERPPRLAVPRNYLFDGIEPSIEDRFDQTLRRLRDAGAAITELELAPLDRIAEMNAGGGFAAAESWAWHRELIASHGPDYDPRVLSRIRRGDMLTETDITRLRERRARLIADVARDLDEVDAFICPTVPIVAPRLCALEDDDDYARVNLLVLRNPTVVNLLDGCAVSIPMHEPGEPPAGLMIAGSTNMDAAVMAIAAWIEERI